MARRPSRLGWFLTWILLIILGGVATAPARITVQELRTKKKRTYQQQRILTLKLHGVKWQQRQISQELRLAQTSLEQAQRDLRQTQRNLARTRAQWATAAAELQKTERQLQAHSNELWKRLNVFYQRGTIGYLEVVVGAADFADFVNRAVLLRTIVRGDMALLRQIRAERAQRAALEASLQARQQELLHLHQRQVENQRLIRVQVARQKLILSSLDRDREAYERSLAEVEDSRRQIEALIRRMTRPRILRSGRSPGGGNEALPGSLSCRLSWPVAGRLTDGFGYRIHPVWKTRRFHDGIDLAAPYGRTIRASAAGRVIHSGWMGAYGRAVIIDHGNGLTTLYGHCSSLLVGNGAQVRKGQPIARVGSTGISTGNHVHFSTYLNGQAVNPHTVR